MRPYHRSYKLVQISNYIKKDRVVDLKGTTKGEILAELVSVLARSMASTIDPVELLRAILQREARISTGVGVGVAIPHARLVSAKDFAIAVGRCKSGVFYESFDEGPVYLVFLILSPTQEYGQYLNVHAKIALLMSNEEFRNKLIQAKDAQEIYRLMQGK